ncbi:MAG: virulence factor SrfC family protein [Acidiphilium sp.]|nr:virulence factor SrfC family protein [Acidiphilium sp.]MDD4936397.1 virulence factor SrfC family protein [Acidiphilium sp.]
MSTPPETPEAVSARAAEVGQIATDAAAWLERNRASLKTDPTSLARDFRRSARRADRLAAAARRPVGVAVFGASQAGKSYLVSRLCAAQGHAMQVCFGATTLDFLRDINPPGGQEATGLVSRFTTAAPPTPQTAPVALRLLSQTDLIRIFANTFFEDFDADLTIPTSGQIEERIGTATQRTGAVPCDGLAAADVEELAEYFERHFRGHALLAALESSGFWCRVAELAPRLPAGDRVALFSLLWGDVARFTAIFRTLIEALGRIGFAAEAFCGLDALTPRETSIIDVRTLFELGDHDGTALAVQTAAGQQAQLARPVLAALVAEVIIPVAERPFGFLDNADLLDFPGARTREAITDIDRFLAEPGRIGRAFLRGKVAYLFQRYNADQEIAAMLLCVGPGNQEVQTLPRMVTDWIGTTMGTTAEARAQQRNSLFLVLTKFDSEFEDKQGEDVSAGSRWTTRLQASLIDFFGKAHEWPQSWVPGRAFDNLFWLRNPAIGFGAVFDYTPEGGEIGIGERAAGFVAARRQAYLANDLVARHIADPAQAWDAALTPNDGGIRRLAEALAPVCVRTLKSRQLAARTADLAHGVFDRLRLHWRSDDKTEELRKARELAGRLARALLAVTQAQRFGALLSQLGVSTDLVIGVLRRMEQDPSGQPAMIGTRSDHGALEFDLADILGELAPPAAAAHDRFGQFADMLLAAWQDRIIGLTRDPVLLDTLRLETEPAVILVDSLGTAARRVKLSERIADALRATGAYHGAQSTVDGKISRLAEEMLNNFVAFLGFDAITEAARPHVGNPPRPVFAARPAVLGLPPLGPVPTAYDTRFYADWIRSMARLIEQNAETGVDNGFDRAANDALGTMLARLEPRAAA